MTDTLLDLEAGTNLAAAISKHRRLGAMAALRISLSLAEQLAQRHATGEFQRRIDADTITFSANQTPQLPPSPDENIRVGDDGQNPPGWPLGYQLDAPRDLKKAAQLLEQAGVSIDPRRIDIFQLGSLLCRMVTGRSPNDYLRSPRIVAQVPPGARKVIDAALGFDQRNLLNDAETLVARLTAAMSQHDAEMPATIPHEDAVDVDRPRLPDTTPISQSVNRDTTTISPQTQSGDETDREELPSRLGHYEILERIGYGGMGDVYKGFEPDLKRTVAIKVLPAGLARQKDFVRRFFVEASSAAKLVHPNIIQIYYIGEDQGYYFFAMQFVNGKSLADILTNTSRLGIDNALALVQQALAGLSEAHKQGLVHRDIKPGNILIDSKRKRALLADFGLVKCINDASTKTATGVVMGTVDYISPEQGRGQEIDARSDLYSIGVLMYQMLSGKLPFEAESPTAMIFQHVYEAAPLLSDAAADIPAPLVAIVAKLMSKAPEDRHQTADEVLEDLRAFQSGEPLPHAIDGDEPPAAPTRIQTEPGSMFSQICGDDNPLSLVIAAPQFDDDLELPAALEQPDSPNWWANQRERFFSLFQRHAPQAVKNLQNTRQQIDGALHTYKMRAAQLAKVIQEAESVLAELTSHAQDYRREAEQCREKQGTTADATGVQPAEQAAAEADRIADELDEQIAVQDRELETMRLQQAKARAKYEQLNNEREVLVARLNTAEARLHVGRGGGKRRKWLRLRFVVAAVAIGLGILVAGSFLLPEPELAVLGTISDGRSTFTEMTPVDSTLPKTNTRRLLLDGATQDPLVCLLGRCEGLVRQVVFTPDGRRLLSLHDDLVLRLWDIEKQVVIKRYFAEGNTIQIGKSFSADGRRFVTSSFKDKQAIVWDVETGAKLATFEHRREVNVAEISPDGRRVLTGGYDNGGLWDVDSGRQLATTSLRSIYAVSFSANGRFAAAGGFNRLVVLWDSNTGEQLKTFSDHAGHVYGLAFSQDNRNLLICTNDDTLNVLDIESGQKKRVFTDMRGGERNLFSIRNLVAAGGGNQMIQLFDLETGKRLYISNRSRLSAISPDGRLLFLLTDGRNEVEVLNTASERPGVLETWRDGMTNISALAISPTGELAATGNSDGTLRIWRLPQTGGQTDSSPQIAPTQPEIDVLKSPDKTDETDAPDETDATFRGHSATVSSIATSSESNYALTGDVEKTIVLWDINTRKEIRRWQAGGVITNLAVSQDGTLAAAATIKGLQLWRVDSGQEITASNFPVEPVNHVAFAADGESIIFTSGAGTITRRSVQTGELIKRFRGIDIKATAIAVSSDNQTFAMAGEDRIVRILNFKMSGILRTLRGIPATVNALQFSPNGEELLAACNDNIMRLWNINSGEMIRRYYGHAGGVTSASFSPDGKHVYSASLDDTIRKWDGALTQEVKQISLADLTAAHIAFTPNNQFALIASDSQIVIRNLNRSQRSEIAELHLKLILDGKEELRLYKTHLKWTHRAWGWPSQLTINGVPWNPDKLPVSTDPRFVDLLSKAVSFENATVKKNSGRGRVTIKKSKDWCVIYMNDAKNGSRHYDITVRFPIVVNTPPPVTPTDAGKPSP
ncbi:Serine/threonine-protein kinase PknB [Symmachiella dynata]|uniref:protein kinase domain-containing protein n=1 Tax=Symmachiella dynata TaxID=2527995 RepID=UPI00118A8671|nr:protein kinase [Symmachiella dynata]QDT49025.1 Serine/threonine-protein kinase PknB [Symmachiella dynata]